MSGPKRDADSFNTLGVAVIGICGVVMVYVAIVALQAFYANDTSELQTMADYGGQDTLARNRRTEEIRNITEAGANIVAPGTPQTYRIRIDGAMKLVVADAQKTPDHLVPLLPPAVKTTVQPVPQSPVGSTGAGDPGKSLSKTGPAGGDSGAAPLGRSSTDAQQAVPTPPAPGGHAP